MFQNFRLFMSWFGLGYRPYVYLILAGDVVIAIFETIGILMIFPLMGLVLAPNSAIQSGIAGLGYRLLNEPPIHFYIIVFSGFVGLFYLAKALFHIWFTWWEHQLLARWKNAICHRFFRKFLEADYIYHSQRNSSSTISIISGVVPNVVNNYMYQCIVLVSQIVVALFLFSLVAFRHPLLTIVMAALFLLLFHIQTSVIKNRISHAGRDRDTYGRDNLFAIQQGLGAYKDTKISLKEKFFSDFFSAANRKLSSAEGRVLFFQNLPIATTELIIIVITIIAFNMLVFTGQSAVGVAQDLGMLVMLVFRFIPVVNRSLTAYSVIKSAIMPLHTLVAEAKNVDFRSPLAFEGASRGAAARLTLTEGLTLQGISFSYPNTEKSALRGIDVTIRRGEFVGIIGPSGSGKSTLIAVLLGFLKPDGGTYTVDGKPLDEEGFRALRGAIGYVDQQPFIFDATVMENVAFGIEKANIDRNRVKQALLQAELWETVEALEHGMESQVGENGKRLSGGQRQRLAIARALYDQPSVLILDEATSALDLDTEYRLSSTILGLKGSLTIVAIAHRLSTLRACDRLIMMESGQIVDSGPYRELYERNQAFRNLIAISNIRLDRTGAVSDPSESFGDEPFPSA